MGTSKIPEECCGPANYRFSTCLVALWFWRDFGGCLIIRRSHFGWWPHLIWGRKYVPSLHTPSGLAAYIKGIKGFKSHKGYLIRMYGITYYEESIKNLEILHMVPCKFSKKHKWLPPLIFKGCIQTADVDYIKPL